MEDELKFDCYPQGNAQEDLCLKRGCCWSYTDKQSVPFCYYPQNFALYSFVNVTHLNDGPSNGVVSFSHSLNNYRPSHYLKQQYLQVAFLEQIGSSGYPEDVGLLKLVATFETRNRLRVKIMDAEKERYEVSVYDSIENSVPSSDHDRDYEFAINTDMPGFLITRKSNREVIDTKNC